MFNLLKIVFMMNLKKKIEGLEVGMSYYSGFEKDEEDIVIPFSLSLYITSSKIVEQLPVYLECLRRNECPEVLGIDLDTMTSEAYWMKNYKLEHDMEALNDLPLRERGIEFAYKGFKPETTGALYEAIRQNVGQMVAMLSEVRQLFTEAPASLYENFYLNEKAAVDAKPVKARYRQWKREVGVVTSELLKDKQILEVVEFLKKKVLRFAPVPSERERCQVDLDMLRSHLPHGYELPEELPNCCARLKRFVTMDGDTLRINSDCYGEYLHPFFYRLTAPERQALIEFDLMLDLIHQDLASLNDVKLPAVLATPEAMTLWRKAQDAGWVDERFQSKLSRTLSALFADAMAKRLGIKDKWKVFEKLWNKNNMRSDYNQGLSQQQSLDFQDELKRVLG